jgi:hypothetical protein
VRRATITLPDEIDSALEAYLQERDAPLTVTAVVQSALREYLAARGYITTTLGLRITPAAKGRGKRDITRRHDRYLAAR